MELNIERYISHTPRVTKHVLFWLAYISFFGVLYGSFNEDYLRQTQLQLLFLPEKLVATYVVIYFLMPRFLLRQRYMLFFVLLFVVFLIAGFVHWAMAIYVEIPLFYPGEYWGELWYWPKIFKSITAIYPVVAIAVVIKLFKRWFLYQQAAQHLNQEKLEAELKFLKAQIHPHFLFNTLNNLYALTLKKSDDAPDVVLRLSDLLNYMLYECNSTWVALQKEIELLENYIALEKIRYGQRLDIIYNVRGEVGAKKIAPMVILPFVENSFKHGVSEETHNAWVSIDITLEGSTLTLKVDNSKSALRADDQQEYRAGIGLKNVKRRLELLYRESHELRTIETDESYLIVLTLDLDASENEMYHS